MTDAQLPAQTGRLAWKIFLIQQASLAYCLPLLVYFILLIAQVPSERSSVVFVAIPPLTLIWGIALPLGSVHLLTRRALAYYPGEAPGARLVRILKLPRMLEFAILFNYITGNWVFLYWIATRAQRPTYIALWGASVCFVVMLVIMVWTRVFIERLLMSHAMEELLKSPHIALEQRGLLWPKQSWYLPYVFALFILCTLATLGSIVGQLATNLYQKLQTSIEPGVLAVLNRDLAIFLEGLWRPLLLVALFMLATSVIASLVLTRNQDRGFRAIQQAIEGLANGRPQVPSWVTTDELGDLSRAMIRAFDKLQQFSLSLSRTASTLGGSAETLQKSNISQSAVLSRQAAALQEAQVTAQEIQETSRITAQKATGMLAQTSTFEEAGRKGEATLQQSLVSLEEIREQVGQMAASIRALSERTEKIDSIARVVKDLADRSNMLAINAAIEAVRAGDLGKGFGVVAREMRSLADQSAKATGNVRDMLVELADSIRYTVELTERGSDKVASSLEQVRASSNNMRTLSDIMKDNIASVRQISATVNQQDVGVQQIFQAIRELNDIMDETMRQIGQAGGVSQQVRGVASEVNQLITQYGWESSAQAQQGSKG
jgi:methyl-accepting chemotaxis protein